MTYSGMAAITGSAALRQRLTACAAQERKPKPYDSWVDARIWDYAATPGWADAWASAEAAGNPDPGADETVITDPMILAATQPMQ